MKKTPLFALAMGLILASCGGSGTSSSASSSTSEGNASSSESSLTSSSSSQETSSSSSNSEASSSSTSSSSSLAAPVVPTVADLLAKLGGELAFKGTMSELNKDSWSGEDTPTVYEVEGYVSAAKWYSQIGKDALFYVKGENGNAYAPKLNYDNTISLEEATDDGKAVAFAYESPFGKLAAEAASFDEATKTLTVNVPGGSAPSFGLSFLADGNITPTSIAVTFNDAYEPMRMSWTIPTITVVDSVWGDEYRYEYTFAADFVVASEIKMPTDAPLPTLPEHAALEEAFGSLAAGNYRLAYEDAAQNVTATIVSSASFYDIAMTAGGKTTHEGYCFTEPGKAAPYEVVDGVPVGTAGASDMTFASITEAPFDVAAELFAPTEGGKYVLAEEGKEFASRAYPANFVKKALEKQGIYTLDRMVEGTFAFTLSEGQIDLSFNYEYQSLNDDWEYVTLKGTVYVSLTGIGETENPFAPSSFVPFEAPDTWAELGGQDLVTTLQSYLGDPEILPLPSTEQMKSFSYNDSFGLTLSFVYPSYDTLEEVMAAYATTLTSNGWVAGEETFMGIPYTYGTGVEAKSITVSMDDFATDPTLSISVNSASSDFGF